MGRWRTCAVFSGSSSSSGGGAWLVLTAQKRQPRVQVSPISITVAVPVGPFQHSPMLGHCASSHTVASRSPDSSVLSSLYRSPCAARCRSHGAFRAAPPCAVAGGCAAAVGLWEERCLVARVARDGSFSTASWTSAE